MEANFDAGIELCEGIHFNFYMVSASPVYYEAHLTHHSSISVARVRFWDWLG
jgi:hypothetical protein